MNSILIPTDFSSCANDAAEVARYIAKKRNADLLFLHSMCLPVDWVNLPKTLEDNYPEIKAMIGHARSALEELVKEAEKEGVKATKSIVFLEGYGSVANSVKDNGHGLIVMGSHGKSGFKRFVVGSNAEKIMRIAEAPVLAVKHKPEKMQFKSIVFASGLEPETHAVFDEVIRFAKDMETEDIHLLEITTPYNFLPSGDVMQKMEEYASRHDFDSIHLHNYNHYTIEAGVIEFAQSVNADLIAIANHGRTGLGSLFVESIPENLLRYGDLPVLSIRV